MCEVVLLQIFEAHKIYTLNVLPTQADPDKPGSYCSRKNLLEANRKPFNLERLMPFGTSATCYVPIEKRRGGKEPGQRKSFRGVVLGYVDGMPAYRVWDIQQCQVKLISYNFCICHEGYYPFREACPMAFRIVPLLHPVQSISLKRQNRGRTHSIRKPP